jgi:hypothetical protein
MRLCIQASPRSWRIAASIAGKPVRPSCQARNLSSASFPVSSGIRANLGSKFSRADRG